MKAGAISSTSPSTVTLAPTMASGTARSIAMASGSTAMASGCTSSLLLCLFPAAVDGPVQNTFLPNVEKAAQHKHDEKQHFKEAKQPELPVNDGPRIQENRFNIE